MIPNIKFNSQDNTTLIISCISAEIKAVEKELMKILVSFGDEWVKKKFRLVNSKQIENILNEPDFKSMKFLIWKPQINQNEVTIFINNFRDGWITLLNGYSIKYDRKITMATLSDQTSIYPKYRFYHRDKFNIRIIQLLKEVNSWEFYQQGQPLNIEDESNYNKKRIVDRLNNNIIERYMQKLSLDYTKNEFWISNGDAIEYTFVLGI